MFCRAEFIRPETCPHCRHRLNASHGHEQYHSPIYRPGFVAAIDILPMRGLQAVRGMLPRTKCLALVKRFTWLRYCRNVKGGIANPSLLDGSGCEKHATRFYMADGSISGRQLWSSGNAYAVGCTANSYWIPHPRGNMGAANSYAGAICHGSGIATISICASGFVY